jgi:hypothetical protein
VPLEEEAFLVGVEQLVVDRLGRAGRVGDEGHAAADERKRGESAEEAATGEIRHGRLP